MDSFKEHAEVSGTEILQEMVKEVTKHKDHFHIITDS
jgi:thioredoxin reductase